MGTKLRKFSRSNGTKGMVSFLIVIITIGMLLQFSFASDTGISLDNYKDKIYSESNQCAQDIRNAMCSIVYSDLSFSQKDDNLIEFYYQKGDEVITNVNDNVKKNNSKEVNVYRTYFEKFKNNYYYLKNGLWVNGITKESILAFDENYNGEMNIIAFLAFPDSYFDMKQIHLDKLRNSFINHLVAAGVLAMIGLMLFLYLLLVAGRRYKDDKVYMTVFDKIYSDVLILAYLIFCDSIGNELWVDIFEMYNLVGGILLSVTFTIISLIVMLSITRKLKAKIFIKHSLIYKIYQLCYRTGKDIYQYLFFGNLYRTTSQTKTLYYRQLIVCTIASVSFLLTIIFTLMQTPLLLVTPIIFVVIIFWYIKGNAGIYQKIDKGIEESLEVQMKSERMKIALITNVSHDLKTPLTSIISYVDLLSKEEGLPDTAIDYVKILQIKSDRLKNIVTDLFELAKSTSGNIALEEEVIDLKRLMEQTLADMEDKVKVSELQFKTSLPDSPVVIKSDGKKLYRVFQNIIDNALKYSLKNTRVYINLEKVNQSVVITFKNIAAYEMNFTQEEILQRFYRGDQSRTTEGSGLGLSIAESFTNNCGGKLSVEIDGDVFKVSITFGMD